MRQKRESWVITRWCSLLLPVLALATMARAGEIPTKPTWPTLETTMPYADQQVQSTSARNHLTFKLLVVSFALDSWTTYEGEKHHGLQEVGIVARQLGAVGATVLNGLVLAARHYVGERYPRLKLWIADLFALAVKFRTIISNERLAHH